MTNTVIEIPQPLFTAETVVEYGDGPHWRTIIGTCVTVYFNGIAIFSDTVTPRTEYPDHEAEEERARNIVLNDVAMRLRGLLEGP